MKCTAPLQELLKQWLRDEKKINVDIITSTNMYGYIYFVSIKYIDERGCNMIKTLKEDIHPELHTPTIFNTYEEALEVGLFEALNLIN